MSSEKRRRARVQGGWAASSSSRPRSDDHKPKVQVGPSWMGKTVDSPQKKLVYEEPTEVCISSISFLLE